MRDEDTWMISREEAVGMLREQRVAVERNTVEGNYPYPDWMLDEAEYHRSMRAAGEHMARAAEAVLDHFVPERLTMRARFELYHRVNPSRTLQWLQRGAFIEPALGLVVPSRRPLELLPTKAQVKQGDGRHIVSLASWLSICELKPVEWLQQGPIALMHDASGSRVSRGLLGSQLTPTGMSWRPMPRAYRDEYVSVVAGKDDAAVFWGEGRWEKLSRVFPPPGCAL